MNSNTTSLMESQTLSIRVNVRYVAPANSQIKDALELFRSPTWVEYIVAYIMPQLNLASPTSYKVLRELKEIEHIPSSSSATCDDDCTGNDACVICLEDLAMKNLQLPCGHVFHAACVREWLEKRSTCPSCRHQLPTDAGDLYSIHSINTTIVLQPAQANLATEELMELPAGDQAIQAIVNARVRRNTMPTEPVSVPMVPGTVNTISDETDETPEPTAVRPVRSSKRRRGEDPEHAALTWSPKPRSRTARREPFSMTLRSRIQ